MNTAIIYTADCRDLVQTIKPCWYPLQEQGRLAIASPTPADENLSRYETWRQLYQRAEGEFLRLNRACAQTIFIWQPPAGSPGTIVSKSSLTWQLDAFVRIVGESHQRQSQVPLIRLLILATEDQPSHPSFFDRHGYLERKDDELPYIFTREDFECLRQAWQETAGRSLEQLLHIPDNVTFHELKPDQQKTILDAIDKFKGKASRFISAKNPADRKLVDEGLFAQIYDGTLYDDLVQKMAATLQSLTTAANLTPLTEFDPEKVLTDFLRERLSINRQYDGIRLEIIYFSRDDHPGRDAARLAAAVLHLSDTPFPPAAGRRPQLPVKRINIVLEHPEALCRKIFCYRRRLEMAQNELEKHLKKSVGTRVELLQEPRVADSSDKGKTAPKDEPPINRCAADSLPDWLAWVDMVKNLLDREVRDKNEAIARVNTRLLAEESRVEAHYISDFTTEIEQRENNLEKLRSGFKLPPLPRHSWPAAIAEQDEVIRKLLAARPRRRVMLAALLGSTMIFLLPWFAARAMDRGTITEHFFSHEHCLYPFMVLAVHAMITAFLLWRDRRQLNKQLEKAKGNSGTQKSELQNMYNNYLEALDIMHRQGTMEANITRLRQAETLSGQRQKAIQKQLQWLEEHLAAAEKLLNSLRGDCPAGVEIEIGNGAADQEDISLAENPDLPPKHLSVYHFPPHQDGGGTNSIPGIGEPELEVLNCHA